MPKKVLRYLLDKHPSYAQETDDDRSQIAHCTMAEATISVATLLNLWLTKF
jgi:hypothetical protein